MWGCLGRGGCRHHLGLGGEAGGKWRWSQCSWAAAEVGSQASSLLRVLFLACEAGVAGSFSSPATETYLLLATIPMTPDRPLEGAASPSHGDSTARVRAPNPPSAQHLPRQPDEAPMPASQQQGHWATSAGQGPCPGPQGRGRAASLTLLGPTGPTVPIPGLSLTPASPSQLGTWARGCPGGTGQGVG